MRMRPSSAAHGVGADRDHGVARLGNRLGSGHLADLGRRFDDGCDGRDCAARDERHRGVAALVRDEQLAVLLLREAREVADGDLVVHEHLEEFLRAELGQGLEGEHDGLGAREAAGIDLHGSSFRRALFS